MEGRRYFLPPLTEQEVAAQVRSILDRGLIPAIEHTSDPDPRHVYWSIWKLPLFDARTVQDVMQEVEGCAEAHPDSHVKLVGYDPRRQGQAIAFVVRHPLIG
jgi:ribulose-bisphosphate carboxylase small chain